MSDEPVDASVPVFPQYSPPGLTVADPKQAKPLMKAINRMLRMKTKPTVSRVRKKVDTRRKSKDKWH